MDEGAVNSAKLKPLEPELKLVDAMKDRADLLKEIAHLHSLGVPVFFRFGSAQDDKNSTNEIATSSDRARSWRSIRRTSRCPACM